LNPNFKFIDKILYFGNSFLPFSPRFVSLTEGQNELAMLSVEDQRILSNKVGHGYFEVYSRLFDKYRHKRLAIVELGIGSINENVPSTMYHFHKNMPSMHGLSYSPGGSLRLWQRYFLNQDSMFVGWDIDLDHACIENAKLFKVDTMDNLQLRRTTAETLIFLSAFDYEGIDIFIDDGLHSLESQQSVFESVFPYMSDNGIYIIEDISVAGFTVSSPGDLFLESDLGPLVLADKLARISGRMPQIYQFYENGILACLMVIRKSRI
jgi:hypothetical protein